MGHIGLTPQSASILGGYKPQGRTSRKAHRLLEDALALEEAGCFAIVLEAIPGQVASHITAALSIPTIGIGAGPGCDGQVLVWHDILGLTPGHVPQFVKQYADIGSEILGALAKYVSDVHAGAFPEARHTYTMPDAEFVQFESDLAIKR
jgi:3-methyl-2-oxobutanoate hydroxymethyltransferase